MDREIAVLGTGAIGSSIAADLTRAGHNVLLIDQWPAHIEAMKANGLHVIMPGKKLHTSVKAFHLCELCNLRPQLDIVFLTSKSYDTCWMVQLIKPYLKPDGIVVSIQNSLNNEWITPIVGRERNIACVVTLSAELLEPGRVKRVTDQTRTAFVLGELHGSITPRLRDVEQILSVAGKTEISTNILGAKWSKLVFNSMTPFDAITLVPMPELIETTDVLAFSVKLGRESMQVATALGHNLGPIHGLTAAEFLDSTDELLENMLRKFFSITGGKERSHALQDILRGRRTELEYLNGLVAKKGQEVNVRTPMNEAVTSLIKQIEQGILKPDRANLKILEKCS